MKSDQAIRTGIILAAGGSTRMGSPKALLQWKQAPLILGHIRALQRRCQTIIVVLGSEAERISAVVPKTTRVVVNHDWKTTELSDSLLLALETVTGSAFVTPVDVPPVPESILDALIHAGPPSVPFHSQQPGHPVFIDSEKTAEQLRHARLDQILETACQVNVDWSDTLLNINTPNQWRAYLSD